MYKERKPELLTIREWCLRFGIKVKQPKGFYGKRSQIWSNKYTRKQFERGIRRSYISITTEKGLEFWKNIQGGKKYGYSI